jgi:cytochrome c oxidase subunit 2
MPIGVTDVSRRVYDLHMTLFWICVVIGIIVFGVMIYAIIFHRKSLGHQAAHFHENITVEILWTIIPFIILIIVAIPSTKTLIFMYDDSDAELTIKVTGHTWYWEYEYLDKKVTFMSMLATTQDQIDGRDQKSEHYLLEVDNHLVLPINKKIRILTTSSDVIHSWWVPAFAVKRDAIPGFINETWTKINEVGTYRGQCAELCGLRHGFMPIVVEAVTQEDFDAWLLKTQQETKQVS